jgi:hypothetical protein
MTQSSFSLHNSVWIMDQEQQDVLSQPEFLSFEIRLTEAMHELNMKRVCEYS